MVQGFEGEEDNNKTRPEKWLVTCGDSFRHGCWGILGGAVLIEQVFNIPGMGRLAVTSVMNQDYPYVQAITLIMAVSIVLSNLLVDISYGWLDPRVHYD